MNVLANLSATPALKSAFAHAKRSPNKSAFSVAAPGIFPICAILLVFCVTLEVSPTIQIALPGCQEKCGNVSIPYPFGISEGCYLNKYFSISCNSTSNSTTPKPYIMFDVTDSYDVELLDISLDGFMRILAYGATDCYNKSGGKVLDIFSYGCSKVFPYSYTRNKLVGIGCDTFAVIARSDDQAYSVGCMSLCTDIDSAKNGSCNGVGCCSTSIPNNLFNCTGNITVSSFRNHTNVWEFNPCGQALLVEEASFYFSAANLSLITSITTVPAVLDWAVGNQNCEEAQKNSSNYLCKENSYCYDSDNGPTGYRCNCSAGFQGNPYISNGCQDIDECSNPGLHKCEKNCNNTPGNYTCSCPKGYHGDGLIDGEGCIANVDQLLWVKITVGTGIGFIAIAVCGGWFYYILKKRNLIKLKEKFFKENGGLMLQQRLAARESDNATKIYTIEELKKATDNFNKSNIIGKGGYGIVYRGTLSDENVVAIKKSIIVDKGQIEQFINEVIVLSQINHRNVVKLLGCCLETEVPLLVYEYITNGTLFTYIHDDRKSSCFTWELRLRIATETAGVLAYLHSQASIPIIHRDVKSSNVLLDEKLTAKVSDFGASRLVPIDEVGISTLVQGTLGYLDPEYLLTSQLTEKSDVYSFGVLLAELMTGRPVFSNARPEGERGLAMHFLSQLNDGRLFQIIDCNIAKKEYMEEFNLVVRLVKRCLNVKGDERPSMKEVAMELEGLRTVGKHPWRNANVGSEETQSLISLDDNGDGGETSVDCQSGNPDAWQLSDVR